MATRRVSCGLDFNCVPDLCNCLHAATESGYDFICAPVVHPRFKREFRNEPAKNRPGAFTRSDLILASSDWNNLVVGNLSPYLNVDSEHVAERQEAEDAVNEELNYCAHLGLPAIMFKLRGLDTANLARIIHNKILAGCSYQVWAQVPMEAPRVAASLYRSDLTAKDEKTSDRNLDSWEWWNKFRAICNFEKKVGLALRLSADIPSDQTLERWMGEPLRCLVVPTSLFLTNKKGYPVLSKAHQSLLKKFSQLQVQVVICGRNKHSFIKYYQQYMDHLWQTLSQDDPLGSYGRGYEDYLQCPLQPLMDNLESHTYEVFEKDPVKYSEYQRAIYNILVDRIKFEERETTVLTLMVVGAGRGPLVRAALNAAQKADRKIKVYAIEKNPNAVVTLQAQQLEMWGDQVTVVACDMREWEAPEKADVLISELLGSFGDNELSPECLDGAQKFLKEDGVSIPSSYTSYLSPVQSHKLWSEVRLCKERDKHPLAHFETPYVVHLQNRMELDRPQALFTFTHPNKSPIIDNTRYKSLKFKVTQRTVLHGFAGYFDAVLYKDVVLSITPERHSHGMFSWFPIFFPIKDPIFLNEGDELVVNFWRLTNKKNVWYEWCVDEPQPSAIHNPNGRSYTIGL